MSHRRTFGATGGGGAARRPKGLTPGWVPVGWVFAPITPNEKGGTKVPPFPASLDSAYFILKYLNLAVSSAATIVSTPDFMPQFSTWWWIGT